VSDKPIEDALGEGISRRRMLKRIGAGAAIAWTAPVLTSIRTPAFAQGAYPCPGTDWNCGDPIQECGTPVPGTICVCDVNTEGDTVCWNDFSCGDPRATTCASSSDCTDPSFPNCVTTCCGQTCGPNCGTAQAKVGSKMAGKTAAGR
jgi:hypothetical protein